MAHSHITSNQLGASLAHLLDNTHDISDLSLARLTRVEDDLWKRLPSNVRRAIQDAQQNEMQRRYKSSARRLQIDIRPLQRPQRGNRPSAS